MPFLERHAAGVWGRLRGLFIALLLLAAPTVESAEALPDTNACLRCDREMRKTFESMQAWRRLHGGRYPTRLVDLKGAGLMPNDGAICPEVLGESARADAAHQLASSRREGGDPAGTYEYEMSDTTGKWSAERRWLPKETKPYTRADIKAVLLRRPLNEQVAMLRCSSHRAVAPSEFTTDNSPFRNLTLEGKVYWSGVDWEQQWLEDVPYCCRETIVLFGLKGPPFHSGRTPELSTALDLRPWVCAFGDHPWWWTLPLFDEKPNSQTAPQLRPFFQEQHGRTMDLGGTRWWVDGLVQLQGRITPNALSMYTEPIRLAFVWERKGLNVGRTFRHATWLQGTIWTAPKGETTGWLVWHYADGAVERVPIDYGVSTARFWGDANQLESEEDFPERAWSHHETEAEVGRERWLRLYRQTWANPRPAIEVTALDFVSNRDCPAGPFIVAVNLLP